MNRSSIRSVARRAIATTVALFVLAAPAAPAGAQSPPTSAPAGRGQAAGPGEIVNSWTVTPGGSDDANSTNRRENLSYSAEPGSSIEDSVTLYNFSNVPMYFRVYASDAFNADDGGFSVLKGDETPKDVGSWVKLEQEQITLDANQQVTIPITITVPKDATPGDHVGAVLASSPSVSTSPDGKTVTVDRRTGTRLYVRVAGTLTPDLVVQDVKTSYKQSLNPLGGQAQVTYTVFNRGNVRISGTADVSVAGPLGLFEKKVPRESFPELLPGQSATFVKDVTGVAAPGVAFATVRLTPAAGASSDVTIEPASRRTMFFAPPVAVLLVLLIALFGLLGWRAVRRHRRVDVARPVDRQRQPEPQPT